MGDKPSIRELLGAPIFDGFTDHTFRIRRNLILFSAASLTISINNLEIESGQQFGMVINGISTDVVLSCLSLLIIYELIHFIFDIWHYIKKWRIRITEHNFELGNKGFFGDTEIDYPPDPQQSTLYSWWLDCNINLKNPSIITSELQEVCTELKRINEELGPKEELMGYKPTQHQKLIQMEKKLSKSIQDFSSYAGNIEHINRSDRVKESLRRFDNWFWEFQYIQLFRLFVIDIAFPILLALVALYFLNF